MPRAAPTSARPPAAVRGCAAILVVFGVAVGACGRGPDTAADTGGAAPTTTAGAGSEAAAPAGSASTTATADSGSPAASPVADTCSLATFAEVSSVLGYPVTGEPGSAAGMCVCRYTGEGAPVVVGVFEAPTDTLAAAGDGRPVEDVGDEALFRPDQGLHVRKGASELLVTQISAEGAVLTPQVKRLGALFADRV